MAEFIGGDDFYLVDTTNGRVFTKEYEAYLRRLHEDPNVVKKPRITARYIQKAYFPEILEDGTIINFKYYYAEYLKAMERVKYQTTENIHTEAKEETLPEEDDLNFDDILKIFNKRNEEQKMYEGKHTEMNFERAEEIRRRARAASHTASKSAAARDPEAKETVPAKKKHNIKKIILNIVVALAISATSIAGYMGVDHLATDIRESNIRTYEAELLVPQGAKHTPSIVKRNEWPTEDRQGFWYDNAKIAEEALMMPDEAIDATMYTIYDEMGENRSNGYIDNYGRVIASIAREFTFYDEMGRAKDVSNLTPEEAQELAEKIALHPTAYARYGGCNSLEEYLLKNGFVDRDGNPSEEAYVEAARDAINNQYNIVRSANESYQNEGQEPVLQEENEDSLSIIR